jgi:hypothetical protein
VVRARWLPHAARRDRPLGLGQPANTHRAAPRAAGIDRVHLHRLLARVGLR